ncbi:MAG: glucose uptake protein [Bryobacterales bacterium]|jgi:glucose uptake protein|nr:glucose uptake protein [Bryobacterales bacterium]
MILPGNYAVTLVLLILSLLFWGSWANTFKLTQKWRYELYYLDFSVGVVMAAFIAALTLGTLGWDGFSLLDDVRNAGKRQDMYALTAGAAFNLGNMLLVASLSLAGMSVALPIGLGTALIVGVIWTYFQSNGVNAVFLALGSLAVATGVVLTIAAYRSHLAWTRKQEPPVPAVKGKPVRRVPASRAIILGITAGVLLGSYFPLIQAARETEVGLGPYSIALIFGIGVMLTTLLYSLFFMNLPVQGEPVGIGDYLKGTARQHGVGIFGGMIFSAGAIASLVAYRAEGPAHAAPALSYAMAQGAPVIASLWGLFAWKEFAGAEPQARGFIYLTLVLFTAGIAAVAFAIS